MTLSKNFRLAFCLLSLSFTAIPAAGSVQNEIQQAPSRILFHGGVSGLLDNETPPALAVEYRWGNSLAGLQPWVGGGWATDGAIFAGAGVSRTWAINSRWEAAAGFGPGYYDRHEGLDLGSHLEFYSFAEVGWALAPAKRLVLRLAHISNGSLADVNPGTELLTIGYSVELR